MASFALSRPAAAGRWQVGSSKRRCVVPRAYDRDVLFTSLSPFELMDRQMQLMDQQMAQLSRQMDADLLSLQRAIEADVERTVQEANRAFERAEPGVQIRRGEEIGANSYRYYQSISITSAPRYTVTVSEQAVGPSPWLLVAALLTGAYAAIGAAFARNVHLTTFKDQQGWRLALMWPVLLVTSPRFRQQFWSAVRGGPIPRTTASMDEGGQ